MRSPDTAGSGTDPIGTDPKRGLSPAALISIVVAVLLILVVGFFAFGGRSTLEQAGVLPASNPDVGECIVSSTDHTTLDCNEPGARYEVLAVLDIPESGATREACTRVDSATGMILTTNNSGKLLCVADLGAEASPAPGAPAADSPAAESPAAEAPAGGQGQPDLDVTVGDCVGRVDGQQQKVECGTTGSSPLLAEVGDSSECRNVEGAVASMRMIGIGVPSATYCVGAETA